MKTALALLLASLALVAAHHGEFRGRGLAFFPPRSSLQHNLKDTAPGVAYHGRLRGTGLAFFAPRTSLQDMLKDTASDVKYILETSPEPLRVLTTKYNKELWSGATGGLVGYGITLVARKSAMGAVKIGFVGVAAYVVGVETGLFGRDRSLEEDVRGKAQRASNFFAREVERICIGLCDSKERAFAIGATTGAVLALAM